MDIMNDIANDRSTRRSDRMVALFVRRDPDVEWQMVATNGAPQVMNS